MSQRQSAQTLQHKAFAIYGRVSGVAFGYLSGDGTITHFLHFGYLSGDGTTCKAKVLHKKLVIQERKSQESCDAARRNLTGTARHALQCY